MIAAEIDAQGVPFAGLHLHVHSFLLGPLAFNRVVNANVVFERVGARDVVVVGILRPPNDAARLIFLARDGLELHFDEAVLETRIVLEADRIRGFAGLLEHVWFTRRGVVLFDCPLGFAFAGFGRGPAGRRLAWPCVIEVNPLGNGEIGHQAGCDE